MGPGVAYFPAISLSFKESVAFNFGSRPLRYPVEGYLPLQNPPTADLLRAHKLLGYIKTVLSTTLDTQVTLKGVIWDSNINKAVNSLFYCSTAEGWCNLTGSILLHRAGYSPNAIV